MPTTRRRKPVVEEKAQKCFCCGLETSKSLKNTFKKTRSELFRFNDQYMPICKNCLVAWYEQISRDVGHNPYAACERICQQYDLYYDEDIVKFAVEAKSELSIIEVQMSKMTQSPYQNRGSTYRDTIRRRNEIGVKDIIIDEDEDKIVIKQPKKKRQDFVTEEMRSFWGRAYEDEKDILMLNDHQNDLSRLAESCGYNLETDLAKQMKLKRLCEINLRMQKEIIGDGKSISQLSSEYNKLFKETGLDQEAELDLNNAAFGTWLRDIEMHTPADIWNDPNMYKDFFGGQEYMERFIERPMRNLFTGSKEVDAEYNVNE